MVVVVNSTYVEKSSIYSDESVLIKASVSGADVVLAVVNGVVVQLDDAGSSLYYRRVLGSTIKECTSATVYVVGLDLSGGLVDVADAGTISVEDRGVELPMDYIRNVIQQNWDTSVISDIPTIELVTETRGADVSDRDVILLREAERVREWHSRGRYKTVRYPISIEIRTKKSANHAAKMLYCVMKAIESVMLDTASSQYDYIRFMNDGKNVSMASFGIWKYILDVELVRVFKEVSA